MKTRHVGVCLVIALVLLSCSRPEPLEQQADPDPTASLPAKFKTPERPEKPDFSSAAEDPKYQQAIREASALLGASPQSLRDPAEDKEVEGGVSFDVPQDKIEPILLQAHTDF